MQGWLESLLQVLALEFEIPALSYAYAANPAAAAGESGSTILVAALPQSLAALRCLLLLAEHEYGCKYMREAQVLQLLLILLRFLLQQLLQHLIREQQQLLQDESAQAAPEQQQRSSSSSSGGGRRSGLDGICKATRLLLLQQFVACAAVPSEADGGLSGLPFGFLQLQLGPTAAAAATEAAATAATAAAKGAISVAEFHKNCSALLRWGLPNACAFFAADFAAALHQQRQMQQHCSKSLP